VPGVKIECSCSSYETRLSPSFPTHDYPACVKFAGVAPFALFYNTSTQAYLPRCPRGCPTSTAPVNQRLLRCCPAHSPMLLLLRRRRGFRTLRREIESSNRNCAMDFTTYMTRKAFILCLSHFSSCCHLSSTPFHFFPKVITGPACGVVGLGHLRVEPQSQPRRHLQLLRPPF
jgi:hypothetical protein